MGCFDISFCHCFLFVFLYLSSNVRIRSVFCGWYRGSERFYIPFSQNGIFPSNVHTTYAFDGWHKNTENLSIPSMEIDTPISSSYVFFSDDPVHLLSTPPVQPVEMRVFSVKPGIYSSLDVLCCFVFCLLIVTTGSSQILHSVILYLGRNS
jgi:hypothetical protein